MGPRWVPKTLSQLSAPAPSAHQREEWGLLGWDLAQQEPK